MKKLITALIVLMFLVAAGTAFSQWEFKSIFPPSPDTLKGNTGGHGLAVDPEGKIWVQIYGSTSSVRTPAGKDSVCRMLYVFNKNGTPATITGIKILNVSGDIDTLYNSSRGLAKDKNGNILASYYDCLYRINYKTGEGMNKVIPKAGSTLTDAAVDQNGNIVVGPVLPGNPIFMLDPDFNILGNAVDATVGYSRCIECSKDGNTVYWTAFSNLVIQLFTRQDEFSPFNPVPDSLFPGISVECAEWNPKDGYLYMSGGSYFNAPKGFFPNTWYAYDPATKSLVDSSLRWQFFKPANADERPRALAFSVTGDTAYISCFGSSTYPVVQMHVRKPTGVGWEFKRVIDGYTLSQNYPNPFNALTEIKYSIGADGWTTLKVYDMLGREVTTLVNEKLTMGNYTVKFDASKLPSGTYIYELKSGNRSLTEKMTLMK